MEEVYCGSEIAGAIGGQAGKIPRDPVRKLGSAFGDTKKFVNSDSARPSIDHQPVEFAHMYVVAGKAARFLSDDDLRAIFLVRAFKPAGDVYGVANYRVIEPEFRSDIADKHFT